MSFLYKPFTSEYQSQYTWKLRNQFKKPQDILERQLEELRELQEANQNRLSMLEDELKTKFIPDEDELNITQRVFSKDAYKKSPPPPEVKPPKESEELVLPKLSDDTNVTKAGSCDAEKQSKCKSPSSDKGMLSINDQVDALVSHFRRDGYGNNPWIGNKPTSFEYEKMKKIPPSKANIKCYDDNLKLRRAKMYDEYRKEIDLRRLKQLFPYVNFDELNYNAQTQTYDDGIISGTYLSEYGDKYVNWNHPPYPYNRRFEKCSQMISKNYGNNVGTSTSEDKRNNATAPNELSKQMEKMLLNDEEFEICDNCSGYYYKQKNVDSNGNKIVTFDEEPPK